MAEQMSTLTETFYNERGERDRADGLFAVEHGEYVATLIAERRWFTPKLHKPRSRKVVKTYRGENARQLAAAMKADGWAPPLRLGALCESAPRSRRPAMSYATHRARRTPAGPQTND